ncbi:MAG: hypothetical protein J7460_14385, partial [Chloroflexus sp.]|nr:hypothetical protein [Chloroflexus sp.]
TNGVTVAHSQTIRYTITSVYDNGACRCKGAHQIHSEGGDRGRITVATKESGDAPRQVTILYRNQVPLIRQRYAS